MNAVRVLAVAMLMCVAAPATAQDKKPDAKPKEIDKATGLADPTTAKEFFERGRQRSAKEEYDAAIKDFNEAIRLDPKLVGAFHERANAWAKKGNPDKAIADLTEGLRLDPKNAELYYDRSFRRFEKGALAEALDDASEAVRLAPDNANALANRGWLNSARGRFAAALADYDESVRLDPKFARVLASRAMLRAGCADPKFRDGKKALEDAKRACELSGWKEAHDVEAYAAACAENGDFAEAVKWQKKVVEDAAYMKLPIGPSARKRLESYEAKEPYRFGLKRGID